MGRLDWACSYNHFKSISVPAVIWQGNSALPPHCEHTCCESFWQQWQCQKWYRKKLEGGRGVSLQPGPKQPTQSTWLSPEQTWHTRGNEHVDWSKMWKRESELYPQTLILLLCGLHSSFMPALMLIWSCTKLIKLINSAVSSSQLGDWAERAQWWVQCAELAQRKWGKHDCGSRKKRAGALLSAAATF